MRRLVFFPFLNAGSACATVLVFVLASVLLAGCGETSFLGRQYDNFTAYYNKFHNAEKAFDEAVTSIKESERPVDRTEYVSVFYVPTQDRDNSGFEKVIQKSADILREHPNSKWVDDALLLIGKSYFYQRNDVGASQKFREVIDMDGEREGEAWFWLARTLVAADRPSEAQEALRNGLNEEDFGPWTARMYLVRGDLLSRQEEWADAISALRQGLSGEVPDKAGARASFLLGQIHETLGQPSQARAAYRKCQDFDPPYELDFAAQLNAIELQGEHGDPKRALERLEDLESDDKNFEMRGEMAVVRAKIYRAQDTPDRARRTLKAFLYGEDRVSGEATGPLHYALASLYRDAYDNFSRAAAHFDTASTSVASSRGSAQEDARPVPDAPVDAEVQAERYRRLAERAGEVARLDSLLRLGQMSDEEFRSFVAQLRKERQAAQKKRQESQDAAQQAQRFGGNRQQGLPQQRGADAADTRSSEAGFLFHQDPARVQEGRREFERTWGERPRADNWRRRSAIRSQKTASTADGNGASAPASGGEGERSSGTATASLDLSAVPRDSSSQAQMEAERAVARYEFANSLFLAAGRPDSAATWYRRILDENEEHPVARRALYALAEAQRAQGDTAATMEIYERLLQQYPRSELAARVRERMEGRDPQQAAERSALADSAYARAYDTWEKGQLNRALGAMLQVADRYPSTSAAPRALLAAGVIYWRMLNDGGPVVLADTLERRLASFGSADSADAQGRDFSADTSTTDSTSLPPATTARETGEETDESQPPSDTLQAAVTDSVRSASPDTVGRANPSVDSLGGVPRDTSAEAASPSADTSSADNYARLRGLLAHITERYPDAPQGQRAQSMLTLIDEKQTRRDSAAVDTSTGVEPAEDTARAVSDSARAPADPPADSTANPSANDPSSETGQESLPPPGAPAAVEGQRDSSANDPSGRSQRQWTLRLDTFSDSMRAAARQRQVRRSVEDQSVDVLRTDSGGEVQHHVVIGTFRSKAAAEEARRRLGRQLPTRPDVWPLPADDNGTK